LTVQVNTVVMRDTVNELPAVARIVKERAHRSGRCSSSFASGAAVLFES
jgi:hypothetical protein